MSKQDYYSVLGVSKASSNQEIKKAYKKMAMKYHPDKNPGDAVSETKFKDVKEAYEILTDAEKRHKYDQFGHAGLENNGQGGFNQRERGFGGQGFGGQGFGGFDFEDMFSQSRGGQSRAQKGLDKEFVFTVDFVDAVQGVEKIVELPVNGETKKIKVKIPAGIKDGEKIRFTGKGSAGVYGGAPGDLLLIIATRAHAFLERENNDLIYTTSVDMVMAALGGEIDVNVLDKRFKLKVPSGTQPGRKFKIKGKGVTGRKGGTGDLFVKIKVEIPQDLTEQQRSLLEQFKELTEVNTLL
ncbi:DnaJ domain-containing protein [Shewanella sp. D64]|uniref:DnaJ C-terminal domain-containing protein n=1 Tax=unclassified Shewanella TaxID=196818 RepID=UPI0022BA6121|nr:MULTISPECIES: DnaJ C-terminal domain-containing protein [unclassified Shewanella]MEC4725035.1 DnaJ domain-containing protein [Shewanella sp. D64]MEC4736936.1 DnaJ domain-containing protein [Shewanella sp. E94]WBJ96531.1 DnaJ domain-containing protein [Shewanella sp. MTB7]